MFLAIELCLAAIFLALAFIRPLFGESWFSQIERLSSVFAQRKWSAALSLGVLALVLRAALLPILPIPQPKVQDEFSHLLLGDTLACGRLANPTHPMWEHFETFHVNWHPNYASMYYPAQGLFLAFGQVFMGHPFWGVWLSCGLMCTAICWALQGWLSPEWAFLGGILAVIRLGTFSYWSDSYWGGSVAALGGALVLGAFPRIKRAQRVGDSVLFALGLGLLAASRPFEGLFFSLPFLAALLWWGFSFYSPTPTRLGERVAAPVVVALAIVFGSIGYYFWRVTGSPFTTPYELNIRTYGLIYFPWQKVPIVPEFHHEFMKMMYSGGAVVGMYNFARQHPIELQLSKALLIWLFYFGPILSLPWFVWLLTCSKNMAANESQNLRFFFAVCFITCAGSGLTIYVGQPHYYAALTATFYAATLLVMKQLWTSASGRCIVRAVALVCLLLFVLRIASSALGFAPKPSWTRTWCSQDEQNLERARILNQLELIPGEHIVIVRYSPDHDFILNEWVFNRADINGAKVLWARDMGPKNAELLQYFNNRKAWLVEPDLHPAILTPYAQ